MTGALRAHRRSVALVALLIGVSALSVGCGYTLAGRGSFLPDYIETIGVPMFENSTTAFGVEQLLTQEVRQEFIGRGQYRGWLSDVRVFADLRRTAASAVVYMLVAA